jgi:Flp pilus assembly protein TadG
MTARRDRGSATVELVILAPVFAMLLAFVVLVGRVEAGRANVDGVAHSAAREITIARNPAAAINSARASAAASLHAGSPQCRTMGWRVALTAADATVEVSCTVDLAGTGLLPVPGTMKVRGRSTEVVDRLREQP